MPLQDRVVNSHTDRSNFSPVGSANLKVRTPLRTFDGQNFVLREEDDQYAPNSTARRVGIRLRDRERLIARKA